MSGEAAYEAIADALGAMPEARNVFDITDEATTHLAQMPVEDIADALTPTLARLLAEAEERGAAKVRARVEELAADFESEIDWSNGRSNYGDNAAWESAARRLRTALTAEADSEAGGSDE